jgi:hypothetical protein
VRIQTPSTEHDLSLTTLAFLLDVLALNEDTKYWHLRGSITAIGRPNTLQTCARALACGMDLEHPMEFAYAMTRGRGVATLTRSQAVRYFPSLG